MAILDTIKGWMPDWTPTDPSTGMKYHERSTDPTVLQMQQAKKAQEDEEARQADLMRATGGAKISDKARAQMDSPEGKSLIRAQGGSPEDAERLRKQYGEEGSGDWLTNLQRGAGTMVAPKGALDAAEQEIGVPSNIGAQPLAPQNEAAYSPQKSEVMQRNEDPAGATIQTATQFAQDQAQKAQADAQKAGVLDGKDAEVQRTDFGASMTSKIATIATFGAMIATGVGIPFALAAAGAAWAGTGDLRSREEDAKELYKKGYNQAEINNYVHKGVLPEIPSAVQVQAADAKILAQGAKGGQKGLTEQQAKAQFGADRALASQNLWDNDYGGISEANDYPLASLPAMAIDEVYDWKPGMVVAGIKATNPSIGKARDNEIGFLSGVLRPESGSAIGAQEWKNYGHIYFPRRGNSAQQVRQKAWLRDMTIQSLYNVAQSGSVTDKSGEKVVQQMANYAGKIRDYNRAAKAVKLDDGQWYNVADLIGADLTQGKI